MFLEEFLKSEGKRARLNQALSILNEIDFFSVLLELSHKRNSDIPINNVLETAAIQRGYSLGYSECIEDIYNFLNRFTHKQTQFNTLADWGAKRVLQEKGWTEKEIEDARTKRINSGFSKEQP